MTVSSILLTAKDAQQASSQQNFILTIEQPFRSGSAWTSAWKRVGGINFKMNKTAVKLTNFMGLPTDMAIATRRELPIEITLERITNKETDLNDWISLVELSESMAYKRHATIFLMNKNGKEIVATWHLLGCFPLSYEGPEFSAIDVSVAMDKLTLSADAVYRETKQVFGNANTVARYIGQPGLGFST